MNNTNLINEINMVKVVTGRVILHHPNLFIPKKYNEETDPKYSTIVIIPREEIETIKKIKIAINNAIEIGKNKLGENADRSLLKLPLRRGDEASNDIMYFNSYSINANSLYQPGVVDHKNEKILFTDVPNGQYARVSISFHAYNISGNKGISCRLLNVQLLKGRFDPSKYMSDPQEDFKE